MQDNKFISCLSNIRVTYSGLVGLTVGLISVLTGIVFTVIVTRRLSPEEFGIWAIIGSMITYFLLSETLISFWTTRQIARGENVGKTSISSSGLFAMGSIPGYLLLVYLLYSNNESFEIIVLGAMLVPVFFISQTLMGINLGHKPHATSYGVLIFESTKIPAAFSLVYFLDMGISGAIIATLIAYLARIGVQAYFGKSRIKGKFEIGILKRWFRLFWIPLYSRVAGYVWLLDVVLYSVITGSVVGVAYYAASLAIANIVAHSGMISQALYPKLLAKGSHEYASKTLTHLMYFAIPLLGITIIFAKPALFVLNPVYIIASNVVILISIRTFFYVLTATLHSILLGIETVDVKKNPKYSVLRKSKLFLVPTLLNLHYGLYIVTLVITLFILNSYDLQELEMVTAWGIIMAGLAIPFFIYAWYLVKKYVRLSFPFIDTSKYIVATFVFVLVYYLTSESLIEYYPSIFDFLPGLIAQLAICISIYLGITYLIDKNTRSLYKSIINELRKK